MKLSLIFIKFIVFVFFLKSTLSEKFTFNGSRTNITLQGEATITSNGLLALTNTTAYRVGQAFYPTPIKLKSGTNKTVSFSTTFVFVISPKDPLSTSGNGILFIISKTTNFPSATPSQYYCVFNRTTNGNPNNHVFAVELDTVQNPEFQDIDNNHLGIDINGLHSLNSSSASYFDDADPVVGSFKNLSLVSGYPMQVWIDYDGTKLEVTLAPLHTIKPKEPLVSKVVDLSAVVEDSMHVGFSSANGCFHTSHYVLGWSFVSNGTNAPLLDYAMLPSVPVTGTKGRSKAWAIWFPVASLTFILTVVGCIVHARRRRNAELLEDWEQEYGTHRFSYKDLFRATKGFKEKELLGSGGSGRVYKGVLPSSKLEVAVKKVSHESRQGMKQFVAEVVSLGQLRHRNLVQLLGYCLRRGELLRVYDYMPNGSLDKFLYDRSKPTLNWHSKAIKFILFVFLLKSTHSKAENFTFNGFNGANLTLQDVATITSNGLLALTNTTHNKVGQAFYPTPIKFKSGTNKTLSFSTTFAFAISPEAPLVGGSGIVFIISKTTDFSSATASQYFGIFNQTSNGDSNNHVFGVELDIVRNPEFQDINNNHVGIDVNSLHSVNSTNAGYFDDADSGSFKNLTLVSGDAMQVWIDYKDAKIEVTLAPLRTNKPKAPLLSTTLDLSAVMEDSMHVGFSSANGGFRTSHYVLGWSFATNGTNAPSLDYAMLPSVPVTRTKGRSKALAIWFPIASLIFIFTVVGCIVHARRRKRYAELLEDWEQEYGTHRFSYKDLFRATRGFKEKGLLGSGGSGRVYKGVLPSSKLEVAVKKVSHESRQGMKQFVAEVVSLGQLRHRNLVQLLGYCRRRGELLLVYDYMQNGSLDKFLYDRSKPTLDWHQRFKIIRGVASSLLYLHEDWEQVVVHRDIKASNVLLDGELNGRLGDFGLARLYDHGTDPQTTHVVGTMGYLAPELVRIGKATTATDVYAFGAFLLEVACGRRPVDLSTDVEEHMLVSWVLKCWQRGVILEAKDSRLEENYNSLELGLVLKLGLLCLNPVPAARPSMRQVVQYIEGDLMLPELPHNFSSFSMFSPLSSELLSTSVKNSQTFSSMSTLSSLSGGR